MSKNVPSVAGWGIQFPSISVSSQTSSDNRILLECRELDIPDLVLGSEEPRVKVEYVPISNEYPLPAGSNDASVREREVVDYRNTVYEGCALPIALMGGSR